MLVFDATKEVGYKGPGAHHPEIKKDPPRGRDESVVKIVEICEVFY